ncbi:ferritin-like domain-containing protein [Sorangium sp. So ce119]|uniref:ferritin-like domain-containing protein n=1 Tax=Sorangium sp. So ce119 TaxID=3133279 RepID=UPI003F5E2A6F
MQKLAQGNKDKAIDLLNERLTYERASVRLYDSIVEKVGRSADPGLMNLLGQLREYRDQEKEHEEWLEARIRELGGDAHGETEMSRLITIESQGIQQVVLDGDQNPAHLFHALLTAELVDNAGWQLLLELADEADDDEARASFRKRLHEEEDHLLLTRQVVERLTRTELLGSPAEAMAAANPT